MSLPGRIVISHVRFTGISSNWFIPLALFTICDTLSLLTYCEQQNRGDLTLASDDLLLHNLRALARVRHTRGDTCLVLRPSPQPQEFFEPLHASEADIDQQGLVLEPQEGEEFGIVPLASRQQRIHIGAFCDGTRSTYFVGHEGALPILYTRNAAAVRTREATTGHHTCFHSLLRQEATLLAPFGLFPPVIRGAYDALGLCRRRLADLTKAEGDESGPTPVEMERLGSQGWQARAMRRARRLLDVGEQVVALVGARTLRESDPDGHTWLLKDGSLFQFDKKYLQAGEPLRQVVSAVKTHPVAFFGVKGERMISELKVGERSVAFLPRPIDEAREDRKFEETPRPMVSWYLRVQPSLPHSPNLLSGVVRLDVAAVDEWRKAIDEVSWAVLDEFYGLSARPDPRADVMPFGTYDCEQYLKAREIPSELLLAPLA